MSGMRKVSTNHLLNSKRGNKWTFSMCTPTFFGVSFYFIFIFFLHLSRNPLLKTLLSVREEETSGSQ